MRETDEPPTALERHLFPLIGELHSEGEEFESAAFISQLDGVKHWENQEAFHGVSFRW